MVPGDLQPAEPLLLDRSKVCRMLAITVREFYALVEAGKLHPIHTRQRHIRVPLAEVMALKAELAHRAIALPWEKFIQAATVFSKTALEVNEHLVLLGYPRAPIEYIERQRLHVQNDPSLQVIREHSLGEFFRSLGRAQELLQRRDLRLMVECLAMIAKGEEEIAQILETKFGRGYGKDDVLRFLEYFYNWKIMDPSSVAFYFEYLQGREKVLKDCAYKRADPFIYYALGIDFGGEVGELLERSCLGLMHKLNFLIDGYVYGDAMVAQKDIMALAETISTLLTASKNVREGKVPKGKQGELADVALPKAVSRESFFAGEKKTEFQRS